MKLKVLIITFLIFVFFSCTDEEFSEVNIRVANLSSELFEDTTFDGVNFGNLEPGEVSEYEVFVVAYHFGNVSITINGENFGWVPIDFVGETPLENGNYTFQYRFDPNEKILRDMLIKD